MLVLSRRETEKVVFPSLGIAVEVLATKGNKVRLGIDAPPEIRVVRAEIEDTQYDVATGPIPSNDPIQSDIESINLAIQLAQNQLRQGLEQHAGDALEQAYHCLQDLEAKLIGKAASVASGAEVVRESRPAYRVQNRPLSHQIEIGELTRLLKTLIAQAGSPVV